MYTYVRESVCVYMCAHQGVKEKECERKCVYVCVCVRKKEKECVCTFSMTIIMDHIILWTYLVRCLRYLQRSLNHLHSRVPYSFAKTIIIGRNPWSFAETHDHWQKPMIICKVYKAISVSSPEMM